MRCSRSLLCALALACALAAVASADYLPSDDVVLLNKESFDAALKSKDIWLIKFFAPWCGHCKSMAADWKKTATALKGVVKIGAVDMTAPGGEDIGRPYGIQGFPTIKVFGVGKGKPTDYQGPRTAAGFVAAALEAVSARVYSRIGQKPPAGGQQQQQQQQQAPPPPSKPLFDGTDVVQLSDADFDDFIAKSATVTLVEFYAPWCGHCKTLAPEWIRAAAALKGEVNIVSVDATVHAAAAGRFNVRGYPTIKVFAPGATEPTDYEGGRTAEAIIAFAHKQLEAIGVVPEAVELTSPAVWESACGTGARKSICVVSVLPHILDTGAAGRTAYLDLLRSLAARFRAQPFAFLWAEAGKQPAVEAALGLTFGFPAVASVSPKKSAFSLHRSSFTEEALSKYFIGLSSGLAKTQPLAALPSVATTEAWDGKDGKLDVVDDSLDLDDIQLEGKPAIKEDL